MPVVGKQTYTANGVSFDMVKVDGGTFIMGATPEMKLPWNDEKPAHQVTLSGYYIGRTVVTQALWKAVMGNNPSYREGDDLPVTNVSWNDCQKFLSRLNGLTGKKFRLPTEAEWEFAARGGNYSRHTQYSGSDDIDKVAWYQGNSDGHTHPVAQKMPNELGLYDMSGNVWEWCNDLFGTYSSEPQINPTGPEKRGFFSLIDTCRICRGGSMVYHVSGCRISTRLERDSGKKDPSLGLRLCLSE